MQIIIADDEPLARRRLQQLLQPVQEVTVVAEAANGQQLLDILAETPCDLLLLDIRMPRLDGMAVAKHITANGGIPLIIFTTAYSEHAVDAFGVNAVDYLLKPIRMERLQQALVKAEQQLLQQPKPLSITITGQGEIRQLPLAEIGYFQAAGKYVVAITKSGEVIVNYTLKQLLEQFPQQLLQIHRNAVVQCHAITALEQIDSGEMAVTLRGISSKPVVSRRHTAAVRRWIKDHL